MPARSSFHSFSPVIRLGILGSGSGSNMQAILDAIAAGTLAAEISLVLSDLPEAYILERAARAGLPSAHIDCHGFKSKFPDEAQLQVAHDLKEAGVELVCLAGFMRLLRAPLLDHFPGRIINIHPSLLPKFPGLHAWTQNSDETRRRLIGNALGDLMNPGTVESPCCAGPFGDDSMEIAGRPFSQA